LQTELGEAIATPPEEFDGAATFLALDGEELFHVLAKPTIPATPIVHPTGSGGAASLGGIGGIGGLRAVTNVAQQQNAAGLGGFLDGVQGAALRILNFFTYYLMKDRAGKVGQSLASVLGGSSLGGRHLHLAGHSFGGRVVTSAAQKMPQPVDSMTLMQAAYSHYGMAKDYDGKGHDGLFRSVITQNKVRGPIVVTKSVQDIAVGIAYAIASRIARQIAEAIGDANDPYGGIGRNGAQKTPEAANFVMGNASTKYNLMAGVPNNIDGDLVITGHSDITRDEVTHLVDVAVA
jgi:hypothetical protein